MDVGAYVSYEHEGIGRAYQAGIFHLDTEGFGEVELALAGAARGEGNCKSSQQMFVAAQVYSCCTPCSCLLYTSDAADDM
eukprot:6412107-Alexandrium_andersonii.AAC.1